MVALVRNEIFHARMIERNLHGEVICVLHQLKSHGARGIVRVQLQSIQGASAGQLSSSQICYRGEF